jgi:hypothetical protein
MIKPNHHVEGRKLPMKNPIPRIRSGDAKDHVGASQLAQHQNAEELHRPMLCAAAESVGVLQDATITVGMSHALAFYSSLDGVFLCYRVVYFAYFVVVVVVVAVVKCCQMVSNVVKCCQMLSLLL